MQNSNYVDYEQMSSEIINSKYNNIGLYKRQKKFFTKRKIIFLVISLSVIILVLYLIFRPSKKKSPENENPIENTKPNENNNLSDLDKELEALTQKEEELKSENNKLKSQKDTLQKENEDLEKQIKELNEKNKQNDNDKSKVEKEIKEKNEKIKEYEKKVKESKETIEKLNKKGKDLKDKKEENDKEIKSLQSKIEELEKELKVEEKKEENKNSSEKKEEEKKDNNKEDNKDNENKKSEEPQPINPELVSRIDSKIIMEYKHLEVLDKWFGKKLKFKLLFRATEDSYSANEFHKKVDEFKNTIIIIKDINNFIYGGFTTKTWDGNKLYKSDKNSILFNLDKEKYYEVNNAEHAIFCDKELLATFGEGDLILGPKSIESAFPKSFGNKDIKDNELSMGYNKLSPVEMEVFQLS